MDNQKEEIHELTDKDLEIFKKECLKWIDIFGLRGWRIKYTLTEKEGIYGSCSTNLTGKTATITLAKFMDKNDYSIDRIKKTAYHEVCELLLARINALADYRHTTRDELTEEIHNIIRTMEYIKENIVEVLEKVSNTKPIFMGFDPGEGDKTTIRTFVDENWKTKKEPGSLDEQNIHIDCIACGTPPKRYNNYCVIACKHFDKWTPKKEEVKENCSNCKTSQDNTGVLCDKLCNGYNEWVPDDTVVMNCNTCDCSEDDGVMCELYFSCYDYSKWIPKK